MPLYTNFQFMNVCTVHYNGRPTLTGLTHFSLFLLTVYSPLPPHAHMHTHTQHNTQWGETALHFAVQEEHKDIVDLLLEANADPDMPLKVIHTCTKHELTQHCIEKLFIIYILSLR